METKELKYVFKDYKFTKEPDGAWRSDDGARWDTFMGVMSHLHDRWVIDNFREIKWKKLKGMDWKYFVTDTIHHDECVTVVDSTSKIWNTNRTFWIYAGSQADLQNDEYDKYQFGYDDTWKRWVPIGAHTCCYIGLYNFFWTRTKKQCVSLFNTLVKEKNEVIQPNESHSYTGYPKFQFITDKPLSDATLEKVGHECNEYLKSHEFYTAIKRHTSTLLDGRGIRIPMKIRKTYGED